MKQKNKTLLTPNMGFDPGYRRICIIHFANLSISKINFLNLTVINDVAPAEFDFNKDGGRM